MQFSEFIGQVQHRARLASEEEALRATRATLTTLSERLIPDEAENVAAQLPEEIGNFLRDGDGGMSTERLSLDEFFQRVSEREHEDLPQAVYHARAVCDVLLEAIDAGQARHMTEQLPEEFNRLFAGSEGRMRGS